MRLLAFLFISSVLFFSCKDDDDTQAQAISVSDIEIATGVVMTDENGQGIGSAGNPNWYNGLILYPNPPAVIQTAALQSGQTITDLYILPADKNADFSSSEVMDTFNDFDGYTLNEIQLRSVRNAAIFSSSTDIQISLSGLAAGYYRVIVLDQDDVQHGSTIFIDSTLTYPDALRDFLISDWE